MRGTMENYQENEGNEKNQYKKHSKIDENREKLLGKWEYRGKSSGK